MGKFDGLLLCSDWDGTLRTANGLLDSDLSAIKYFQEHGGLFTICSGRPIDFLEEYYDRVLPNTYTLSLNGALIIHPESRDVLFEGFLDERAPMILKGMIESGIPIDIIAVHYKDESGVCRTKVNGYDDFVTRLSGYDLYKIVFITKDTATVSLLKSKLAELDTDGYIAVSSWSTSIELLFESHSKGAAIRRLKEHTGARLSIAVGDYENDIPMLTEADIAYAVGDAAEPLKAVADRITVPAAEGAISHIIKELEEALLRSASK